tara:strand:- start:909 stop:1439 length:531 start_codon:yes stop_codon:yes gene_type:complete
MIKIISGNFRGRKLSYINIDNVRPTQAKVRKSIMDSIRDFENKTVLDLFSGVGTLGIEALSRGAKEAKFVDNNIKVINILRKNLALLEIVSRSSVIKCDAINYLKNEKIKYDLIFADPPYGKYKFEELYPLVSNLLNKNGLFCFESNKYNIFDDKIKNLRIKEYGNIQVVFWENRI